MSERFSANPNNLDIGADLPHCARYFLARGFIKPGEVVVDAACGPGYGSALLAQVASKVTGLDYMDAFDSKWQSDKIEFKIFDLEKETDFPECDAWVSIETIEHLYNPQLYLDKVVAATKRIIIMSSPNRPTVGLTPFHHSDVLITNMQHYMEKYKEDWIEYHSFMQGTAQGQWIMIYIKKGSIMYE